MQTIKLSIIVPVYNAEKYLAACIHSIREQTLQEWELILVDDGSKDESGEVCDGCAALDSRIRVVHKTNEGVSAARNTGLRLARGEYVGFVDADDTILPETYARMCQQGEETAADIVMCDAVTVGVCGKETDDTITQLQSSCVVEKKEMTPSLLKEMAGSACRCVYRKKLVEKGIQFPITQKFSEDRVFNLYMMGYANKIAYLKEGYYRRYLWEESAVHRFHADYFEAVKAASHGTEQAIREAWNDDKEYQKAYLEQFIAGSIAAINNYFYKMSTLTKKEKKQAVRKVCEDEQLQNALRDCPYKDMRAKWILKKRVGLLCLCAKILNKKYRR